MAARGTAAVSSRIGGLTINPRSASRSGRVSISVEADGERIGGLTINDPSALGGQLSISWEGDGERSGSGTAGKAPTTARCQAALDALDRDRGRGAQDYPPVLRPVTSDLLSNAPNRVGRAPANRCSRPLRRPLPVPLSNAPEHAVSTRPTPSARSTPGRPMRPSSGNPAAPNNGPEKLTAVLARLASLDDDDFD